MSSNISVPRLLSRKTVSARGGITSQVIHAPGVGGMVTDVPSWQLKTTPVCQVPFAQDIIFPAGVAAVRGAPVTVTTNNVTGLNFPAYPLYDSKSGVFHLGDHTGQNWNSVAGSTVQIPQVLVGLTPPAYIPFVVWGDEVLYFPQDGISSIVRMTSLQTSAAFTAGNNLTFTANTTSVSIATGGFTAHNNGSWYTQYSPVVNDSTQYRAYVARLRTVASDTSASIDFPPAWSVSGQTFNAKGFGVIGLATTVADMGTATLAAGTVTGQGTQWNTSGIGYGQVYASDIFTYQGAQTVWGYVIGAPTANSFQVTSALALTASPYTVRRSLVGTHGCVYNGRLWVVGCKWQSRRLYFSPLTSSVEVFANPATQGPIAPWTLGDQTNGYYSATTNIGDANEMPWLDVPDKNTVGKLVAVAPSQSGLVILATDGTYMLHGDPPSESVRLLAAGADCMDNKSVVVNHGAVFYAGLNGIFNCTGGRVTDLTEHGGRSAEWQELAETVSENSGTVVAWCVSNHLVICTRYSETTTTWVYDLHRQVWCGNHTTPNAWGAWTAEDVNSAYITASVPGTRLYEMHEVYEDEGAGDLTANPIIDLPLSACGIDISEERRVVENKVTFELVGTNAQFGVLSAIDNAALSLDQSFVPVTGISTQRILPSALPTGSLGVKGNIYKIRLSANGTNAATTWRAHMLILQVRNWPGRIA